MQGPSHQMVQSYSSMASKGINSDEDQTALESQYEDIADVDAHPTMDPDSSILLCIPIIHKAVTLRALKYVTFLLCGMANLWPWNCFLSASEYFRSRLESSPALSSNYSSTMMTVWTLVSTVFNFYVSQKQENVDYLFRLKLGCLIQIIVFFSMSVGVLFPQTWTTFYFSFVMLNVAISAVGACLTQVAIIALVNVKGPIYANANVVGNAISGVLPSISMIIAVVTNKHAQSRSAEGAKYFLTSVFVTLVALIFAEVTAWHENQVLNDGFESQENSLEPVTTQRRFVSFKHIWQPLKFVESTIILVFSITLAFPIFASFVDSHFVSRKVFVPVIFLVWNLGDLAGRVVCAWKFFVVGNQKLMVLYAVSRIVYIPLFMLCNAFGRNENGSIITDIFYIMLQFMFGFSNGQLFSSAFMLIGHLLYTDDEKKAAGGYTALVINISLLLGSIMSYLLVVEMG